MLVSIQVQDGSKEWCILEFQGELAVKENTMKDIEIGSLSFENEVPTLRIGNHILSGKVMKLVKPFAILKKEIEHTEENEDMKIENSNIIQNGMMNNNVQYKIIGIARRRLVFASRPRPVLD